MGEFCVELILFYEAAEQYHHLLDNSNPDEVGEAIRRAHKIYEEFVAVGSPNEINISNLQRNHITEAMAKICDLKGPDPDMFLDAQNEVLGLMTGSLSRFKSKYSKGLASPERQPRMSASKLSAMGLARNKSNSK
eukprot:352359_1